VHAVEPGEQQTAERTGNDEAAMGEDTLQDIAHSDSVLGALRDEALWKSL